MKIIVIGNYPPRKCGIATFTENLVNSLIAASETSGTNLEIEVIAMNDSGRQYSYPDIVKATITDNNNASYLKVANYINASGAHLCLLQHEYGIFGGNSGLMILSLVKALKVPLITTFHTVLEHPGFHQREVLKTIARYSLKVVIMCRRAIKMLETAYGVDSSKIEIIEHGVPDFASLLKNNSKKPEKWQNRRLIFTFGLLNRNKGIETVIRALPEVVKSNPDVLYVVLGKTHPNVVKEYGEEYRNWLIRLTDELNLKNNVEFIDQYISEKELARTLSFSDIYITPYLNKTQITSGTLAYALGAGLAVVSTPYWHAESILSEGTGMIFDFGNSKQLSVILNNLLQDNELLQKLKTRARGYGIKNTWPKIGKIYLEVINFVVKHAVTLYKERKPFEIPPFSFNAIERLTDDTGILQHANGIVPYYSEGYSLDDNARALIAAQMAYYTTGEEIYLKYIIKYLSFVMLMYNNGSFNNILSYSRNIYELERSEDSVGRTMWALGYLIRNCNNDAIFRLSHELFHLSLSNIEKFKHTRGFANTIFGLYHYVKKFPDQIYFIDKITFLADKLCSQYKENSVLRWNWFDKELTYDNGLLPASLYLTYELTKNKKYLNIADDATRFLEDICFSKGHLSLIGNRTWSNPLKSRSYVGQQPLDAAAMVILYDIIYKIKRDNTSKELLKKSFMWFFGENDLNIPMYNPVNEGVFDGLEEFEVSQNQGAESNIMYLLAYLTAKPYFVNSDKKLHSN
jgi:glycosyltransferase involved in cell wall biosynthesis